tara:strand:- start:1221 stop:1406 length:186 start_codon:yes stop_codon:yes gene_type:complete
MKKKACKKCKIFVKESVCPVCQNKDLSDNWQGRVYIVDANASQVAKKTEITTKGEYAIKVR